MTTSAPNPPVSSWTAATVSSFGRVDGVGGAQLAGPLQLAGIAVDRDDRARARQAGTHDGGVADASAADDRDRIPARDVAGVDRRAEAGHHPAAEQTDHRRVGAGIDLGALTRVDEGLLRERADTQRGSQFGAVLQGHLLTRVVGVEAVLRAATLARPALPAHRAPVEDHEVADGDGLDPRADLFDDPCGLMAKQEWELIVDAALAVGEVGVAHPAGLHPHDHLAGAGIWDRDGRNLYRRTLGAGDHTSNLLWHTNIPCHVRRFRA